jgi:uncharacterized protein with PhoU and TrkA domain
LSTVIYTSCTNAKKEALKLEVQISELNKSLKKLDSISLKVMKTAVKILALNSGFPVLSRNRSTDENIPSDKNMEASKTFFLW